MSISKERWIATGDPRSGDEVYDDEGFEIEPLEHPFTVAERKANESVSVVPLEEVGDEPCACGHPRDCHANENVQPNCCECGCAGFTKESVCSECGDYLEPKTPEDRVYVALFNAHRECLEALTPADHAERVKKLVHAWQDAAWLKFEEDCKRSGMVASAYTAFKCGYRAGKFDYETEGR
jgi:hypothetical protein